MKGVLAVGIVVVLGCGDSGSSTSTSTSTSGGVEASSTSSGASTSSASSTSSVDGSEGSTGDVCQDVVEIDGAGAWAVFGFDAFSSRANVGETVLSPFNVGCLEPRWVVEGLAGVTSTPAVVGGVVVFGDWDGVVHAVDARTGEEVWTASLGVQVNDSPLVVGDTVWIGDYDGLLHALDFATGEVRWSVELDPHPAAAIFGSPVLADGTLLVGVASIELTQLHDDYTFRGSLVALEPSTGDELWRVYTTQNDETAGAGVSVWSTPSYDAARGLAYVGTGNTYEEPASPLSDALLAVDVMTGDIVWSRQFTEGDVYTIVMDEPQGPDADIGAAPNLFSIGDRDVVGVGDKAGVYAVLDRDDGEPIWGVELTVGSHLGGVMTSAAVHDGVIYLASNLWPAGEFQFDDPLNTSIAFALDAANGDVLWQRPLAAPSFGAVTWANGVIVLGTIDGTVHALDAATGVELWSDVPGGDIGGGFSIVDGTLYAGYGFWFFLAPPEPAGGLAAYMLPGAP
jgi:polyvinyl alcohol dehydrogenase (cytochrome)